MPGQMLPMSGSLGSQRSCWSSLRLSSLLHHGDVVGFHTRWELLDSNQRSDDATGLQPVPFSLSGKLPCGHVSPDRHACRSNLVGHCCLLKIASWGRSQLAPSLRRVTSFNGLRLPGGPAGSRTRV